MGVDEEKQEYRLGYLTLALPLHLLSESVIVSCLSSLGVACSPFFLTCSLLIVGCFLLVFCYSVPVLGSHPCWSGTVVYSRAPALLVFYPSPVNHDPHPNPLVIKLLLWFMVALEWLPDERI